MHHESPDSPEDICLYVQSSNEIRIVCILEIQFQDS